MAKKYVPRGPVNQPNPAEAVARKVASALRKHGVLRPATIIEFAIKEKDPKLAMVVQEQVKNIDISPGSPEYKALVTDLGKLLGYEMGPTEEERKQYEKESLRKQHEEEERIAFEKESARVEESVRKQHEEEADVRTEEMLRREKEKKQQLNITKENNMSDNKNNKDNTININAKKEGDVSSRVATIINKAANIATSLDMSVTSFDVRANVQRLVEIIAELPKEGANVDKFEKEIYAIDAMCASRMTEKECVACDLTSTKMEQGFMDSIKTYLETDGKKGKTMLMSAIENLAPHRCLGDEWHTLLTKRGWGIGVRPMNQLRKDGRRLGHRATTLGETALTSVVAPVATVAQGTYLQVEILESIVDTVISGVTHLFGGGKKKNNSDEE